MRRAYPPGHGRTRDTGRPAHPRAGHTPDRGGAGDRRRRDRRQGGARGPRDRGAGDRAHPREDAPSRDAGRCLGDRGLGRGKGARGANGAGRPPRRLRPPRCRQGRTPQDGRQHRQGLARRLRRGDHRRRHRTAGAGHQRRRCGGHRRDDLRRRRATDGHGAIADAGHRHRLSPLHRRAPRAQHRAGAPRDRRQGRRDAGERRVPPASRHRLEALGSRVQHVPRPRGCIRLAGPHHPGRRGEQGPAALREVAREPRTDPPGGAPERLGIIGAAYAAAAAAATTHGPSVDAQARPAKPRRAAPERRAATAKAAPPKRTTARRAAASA